MNLKDLTRPLEISDVDFRVQSVNKGGYATILAYKNIRMRIEVVQCLFGMKRIINGCLRQMLALNQ